MDSAQTHCVKCFLSMPWPYASDFRIGVNGFSHVCFSWACYSALFSKVKAPIKFGVSPYYYSWCLCVVLSLFNLPVVPEVYMYKSLSVK